jgi:hypothetical protein
MNELLLWMSARHSGSAEAFRSKVAELGLVGGRWAQRIAQWNVGSLGHAEFAPRAGGEGWRVAPPVLAAGDPCRGGHAFLCGARAAPLLARLSVTFGSQLSQDPQIGGPDIVQVAAPTATVLADQAAAAGIEIQWNAPLAILACCPRPSALQLPPMDIPVGGWHVSLFSETGFEWVQSSMDAARSATAGLFRFRSDFATHYILIEKGAAFATEAAAGKCRLFRRRYSAIAYRSSDQALIVRASCRPPPLVERALILSSGALPTLTNGLLTYGGVEPIVASAVATLLDQRLR